MRNVAWLVAAAVVWTACSGDDGKDDGTDGDTCVGEGCDPTTGDDDDDDVTADDADDDGYVSVAAGGDDCDDADPGVHPGATDTPYDGVDQDCLDGDLVDVDGDTHAAEVAGGDDCNDDDAATYPGARDEVGDSVDQNCDALDGVDGDGDGFASTASGGDDCVDTDAAVHVGTTEVYYDGVDQDCDGGCDYDMDGDGAVLPGTAVANDSACDQQVGFGVVAPEDCDDEDATVSITALLAAYPAAGDLDVSVALPVRATLTLADPSATLTVTDDAGVDVDGTLEVSGALLTFTPDAPLAPDTVYDVTITHGCGVDAIQFTTEPYADPVDPATLVGQTYDIVLADGTWVEPAGLGTLISGQLGDAGLLVDVLDAGATLDLRIATSELGVQDVCYETVDLVADFGANPSVAVSPDTLPVVLGGAVEMTVLAPTLSGRFSPDATTLDGVRLVGTIDTQPLGAAFGLGGTPNAVCDFIGLFGIDCTTCFDGSSDYCLVVRIDDLQGVAVPLDTIPRTYADIAADPACY